jgi:multiple sugar transport system ATP-binding protein
MAAVELRGVSKSYDGRQTVIHGIDLEVREGEFVVFVGPSGCGKSTLLRMIAGLESISGGEVRIGGERVNERPPRARGIAMVFQELRAVSAHEGLRQHGLRDEAGQDQPRRDQEARRIERRNSSRSTTCSTACRNSSPAASASASPSAAPSSATRGCSCSTNRLSNLDAALRVQTRLEIAKLHHSMSNVTMIYVTHDQVEAMTLADRIAPPMNLVPCRVDEGYALLGPLRLALPYALSGYGGERTLGLRPENLRLSRDDELDLELPATLQLVEPLGAETLITVRLGDAEMIARVAAGFQQAAGSALTLYAHPRHLHLFDRSSGQALR